MFYQPCFFSLVSKKESVHELIIVLIMVSNNSVARDSTVLRISLYFWKVWRSPPCRVDWIRVKLATLTRRIDLIGQKWRPILYFFSTIIEGIGREPYLSKK